MTDSIIPCFSLCYFALLSVWTKRVYDLTNLLGNKWPDDDEFNKENEDDTSIAWGGGMKQMVMKQVYNVIKLMNWWNFRIRRLIWKKKFSIFFFNYPKDEWSEKPKWRGKKMGVMNWGGNGEHTMINLNLTPIHYWLVSC